MPLACRQWEARQSLSIAPHASGLEGRDSSNFCPVLQAACKLFDHHAVTALLTGGTPLAPGWGRLLAAGDEFHFEQDVSIVKKSNLTKAEVLVQ